MLGACGLPLGPTRFDLKIDEQSLAWALGVVPRFAIHLSLNSAKATREWPLKHHMMMLRALWTRHPDLVVVTSSAAKARERSRLAEFIGMLKDERLQQLPENLCISRLAAVLQRCRIHIGPDSGVLHLAVALGVPTVSFFRQQGAYKSFLPTGPQHRVISVACKCIDHHDAPCEQLGQAECFATIPPDKVVGLVSSALETTHCPALDGLPGGSKL
jgi:ADP-heptose:LPS heptosyltransferase